MKDMEDVGNVDAGREGREGRGLGTWCIIYLQIRGDIFCKTLWEQWLCSTCTDCFRVVICNTLRPTL